MRAFRCGGGWQTWGESLVWRVVFGRGHLGLGELGIHLRGVRRCIEVVGFRLFVIKSCVNGYLSSGSNFLSKVVDHHVSHFYSKTAVKADSSSANAPAVRDQPHATNYSNRVCVYSLMLA